MNPNFLIADDATHPYPRVCAHRGMRNAAPENSLPAYGAAIALGVDEIELDVLPTKDGKLISMHDRELSHNSNGEGMEYDYTLEELLTLDFGSIHSPAYKGLKVLLFEDVLKKLGRSVIMNIHMKMWDLDIGEPVYEEIAALIRKYHCEHHVYVTSRSLKHLAAFHAIAPEITLCTCFNCAKGDPFDRIERAAAVGVKKLQFTHPRADVIDFLHGKGMICNVCFADDAKTAAEVLAMGADTLLSNNIMEVIPLLAGSEI